MSTLSAVDLRLQQDVLDYLASRSEGRESISYLLSEMRAKGWSGLGNLGTFESTLERLGFEMVREYAKNGRGDIRATYVTV